MKKLFVVVIVLLVIPAVIFIHQKNKFNKISRQTRQEIAEIEKTVDRVLDSSHAFYRKLPHMADYSKALVKKMETTGVLGIHVFDRKERERLYRRFFDRIMDFRRQVLEDKNDTFSNESKMKYMRSLMMACNVLIHQSPATNDKEDEKKDIFAMWSRDMSQLVIVENDFSREEEKEETAPQQQSEWAGLDIVDGKTVTPSVTERKFLTQETRTPVGLIDSKITSGKNLKSG